MEEEWGVLASEVVYDGRFQVIKDRLRRPDGGEQDYTWIPSSGAVAVLAFDEDGRILLTRQYRHPLGQTILDLPAGGINPGEAPADAARRELSEETGYTAHEVTRLGAFCPAPGRLSSVVHVFFAAELQAGTPSPDEEEVIEVVQIGWRDLLDYVLSGEPVDGALAFAVLLWQARLTHTP